VRKLRCSIRSMLLACGMSVSIPAPAHADHRPPGEIYEETRGHAGRDGAWSEQVTSCVGKDGTVYQRRLDRRADRTGETTQDSRAGDPSACRRNSDSPAGVVENNPSRRGNSNALVSVGDVTVSPGDIVLLSPPGQRAIER
jgi:hypothetical protein